MPIWLMSLIGGVAIMLGGGFGYAVGDVTGAILGSVIFATLVLLGYRRVVQRRGITGPDAQRLPTRGVGVRGLRERWGVATPAATPEGLRLVEKLSDLRDAGHLTSDEYEYARERLIGR